MVQKFWENNEPTDILPPDVILDRGDPGPRHEVRMIEGVFDELVVVQEDDVSRHDTNPIDGAIPFGERGQ